MSQERGKEKKKKKPCKFEFEGGKGPACARLRAARRRGGRGWSAPAGIPGLAAQPSGRPAPRPLPAKLAASPRAHYNPQYIISPEVLTMCETPVTPELLSVISTFIHIEGQESELNPRDPDWVTVLFSLDPLLNPLHTACPSITC